VPSGGPGAANDDGPAKNPPARSISLDRPSSDLRPPIRAIALDFWDTLYDGSNLPERLVMRQRTIATLLGAYGHELADHEVARLFVESAREADRWWREEQRGYTTAERLRWLLERAGSTPRADCNDIAAACDAVDEALLLYPPPLVTGAAEAIRALAARVPLAIISDTGFASGRAQDALLEQDGLLGLFAATVYSMDVGYAKPRPEPFRAALSALGVTSPGDVVHIGDNERTDVGGALASGLRAIRLDVVRCGGWSNAELVAPSFDQLVDYINSFAALSSASANA
jgi:FMN phosphatase YigB (HAD superfamily)